MYGKSSKWEKCQENKRAASGQNHVPSEGSNQPEYPLSLSSVFPVRMTKQGFAILSDVIA